MNESCRTGSKLDPATSPASCQRTIELLESFLAPLIRRVYCARYETVAGRALLKSRTGLRGRVRERERKLEVSRVLAAPSYAPALPLQRRAETSFVGEQSGFRRASSLRLHPCLSSTTISLSHRN